MTQMLSTALAVRRKQMIQGSAVSPWYDAQGSRAPWEENAASGNAAGTLIYATVTNVDDHQASKLRLRLAGTAPGLVSRISRLRPIVSVRRAAALRLLLRFGQACLR